MRQDDFCRSMVVLEAWRWGKDYGNQPCQMVAGCLMNRVRLGWGSPLDVLQRLPRFAPTLELPNRDAWPDIWSPEFIKLLHTIPLIVEGSMADPACGGLYWADLSKGRTGVTNPWFIEKVLDSPLRSVCCNMNAFTVWR